MRAEIFGPKTAIRSLAARPVVHVQADATLGEVATAMRAANVSSVLVLDGGRRGIATERDLTRALAAGLGPEDPVGIVTSVHPVRVPGETPVVQAAALMLNEEVRHLVVEDGEGVEAVVSLRDVMAVLLQTASPHLWLETLRIALPGSGAS